MTILVVISVLSFTSCDDNSLCEDGSGNYEDYQIHISDFSYIDINGSPDVFIDNDKTHESLWLTIDDNLYQFIEIYTKKDTLFIRTKDNEDICPTKYEIHVSTLQFHKISSNGSCDIYITDDFDLEKDVTFNMDGSGDIRITDELKAQDIFFVIDGSGEIEANKLVSKKNGISFQVDGSSDINVNHLEASESYFEIDGSADIKVKLDCHRLLTNINGSADMSVNGEYNKFDCIIAGSADIDARYAEGKECWLNLAGSGNLRVNVSEKLTGNITGSGNIYLWGNPPIQTVNIVGSGTIHNLRT
jgi:hypothetical protein